MKIMAYIVFVSLMINVAFAQETNQIAGGVTTNDMNKIFEYMELDKDGGFPRDWEKGGLGIVNTNLYIVVKSATNGVNELITDTTNNTELRWKGESVTKPQIVVFMKSRYGRERISPPDLI